MWLTMLCCAELPAGPADGAATGWAAVHDLAGAAEQARMELLLWQALNRLVATRGLLATCCVAGAIGGLSTVDQLMESHPRLRVAMGSTLPGVQKRASSWFTSKSWFLMLLEVASCCLSGSI